MSKKTYNFLFFIYLSIMNSFTQLLRPHFNLKNMMNMCSLRKSPVNWLTVAKKRGDRQEETPPLPTGMHRENHCQLCR